MKEGFFLIFVLESDLIDRPVVDQAVVSAPIFPNQGVDVALPTVTDDWVQPYRRFELAPTRLTIQLELVQVLRLLESLDLTSEDFSFGPVRPLRSCDRPLRLKITRDRLMLTGRLDRQVAIFRNPHVRGRVLARLRTIDFFSRVSSARATFRVANNFMARVSETDTDGCGFGPYYGNVSTPTSYSHHASP